MARHGGHRHWGRAQDGGGGGGSWQKGGSVSAGWSALSNRGGGFLCRHVAQAGQWCQGLRKFEPEWKIVMDACAFSGFVFFYFRLNQGRILMIKYFTLKNNSVF